MRRRSDLYHNLPKLLKGNNYYRGCYLKGFFAAMATLEGMANGEIDRTTNSEDVVRDHCEYRGIGPHRSAFIWGSQDAFMIAFEKPTNSVYEDCVTRYLAAGVTYEQTNKLRLAGLKICPIQESSSQLVAVL